MHNGVLIERPALTLAGRLRRGAGAAVTDGFFKGAARAARYLPIAQPRFHKVTLERDIAYRGTGRPEHTLDVYRPVGARGPLPVVLYIHGGGFRMLSKDSHWLFGLIYGRRGYAVVNINYHLAPRNPFPAAVEDVCAAYQWVVENAARLDLDLTKLVLAGESAGANLATVLTLAATSRREESYARAVYDTGVVPRATVAACGLFEVSNPERYGHLDLFHRDRIYEVTDAYLHGVRLKNRRTLDLADPVVALERGEASQRPLPPFFIPVGGWDPLKLDSHRLHAALQAVGSEKSEVREYPRGPHAFHAFVMLPEARRCWRDTFGFLATHGAAPLDA